jgi:hypothetical protein
MSAIEGTGSSGSGGTSAAATTAKSVASTLKVSGVSAWFLPAAIGLVVLIAATWNTKARAYVVGFSVLILVGIVLQWGPMIEPQIASLVSDLKPGSGKIK